MNIRFLIGNTKTAIVRGSGAIAAIALTLVISRNFSAEEARNWFIAINLITIIGTNLRWGADEIIVKVLAQTKNKHRVYPQIIKLNYFLFNRSKYAILITILIFSLTTQTFSEVMNIGKYDLLLFLIPSIFFAILMSVGRILQGIGSLNKAAFFMTVATPLTSAVLIYIFSKFNYITTWKEVLLLYTIIAIIYLIAAVKILITTKSNLIKIFNHIWNKKYIVNTDNSEMHRSANILGFVILTTQALPWAGLSIVPIYFDAAVTNAFVVSQKISLSIGLIALIINFTISNKVAKLLKNTSQLPVWPTFLGGLFFIVSGCIVVAFLSITYAKEINIYANIHTTGSEIIFINLVISQIFYGIASYCAVFLTMAGKESQLLKITAIINLTGGVFLFWSCKTQSIYIVSTIYNLSYILYAATTITFVYVLLKNRDITIINRKNEA